MAETGVDDEQRDRAAQLADAAARQLDAEHQGGERDGAEHEAGPVKSRSRREAPASPR